MQGKKDRGGRGEKGEKKGKGGAKAPEAPKQELAPELEWFNACDLRVGKIVECETNESSDKLYFEKIDLGEGQLREIGSGVRNN